jgi:beta-galactosidase
VLSQAQLIGLDQKLPAAVRVKHGAGRDSKPMHYYFNFSSLPQHVIYPYASGTELLSNAKITTGGPIALQPWGIAIVESGN